LGFVTTTPELPGVLAGVAALGTSTVSWTTRVAHSLVASNRHASSANGEAKQAWRTTCPLEPLTHLPGLLVVARVRPLAGFASQQITRATG
jgi:hypothetical protein